MRPVEILQTPCREHGWEHYKVTGVEWITCRTCGCQGPNPMHQTVSRSGSVNPEEDWPFGPPVSRLEMEVGAMSNAEFERLQLVVRQRTRERDLWAFVRGLTEEMTIELLRAINKVHGEIWMGRPNIAIVRSRVVVQVDCREMSPDALPGRLQQAEMSVEEFLALAKRIEAQHVLEGLKEKT